MRIVRTQRIRSRRRDSGRIGAQIRAGGLTSPVFLLEALADRMRARRQAKSREAVRREMPAPRRSVEV